MYHQYTRSYAIPDIVYVPINWSLRFYAACCAKSYAIPDIIYVPINWSLQFYAVRCAKSYATPDIVYVPMKWSLRFYAVCCTKSHAIPDIAYVPNKWSLQFYVPWYVKSYAILTHVVYDFEYIGTLPLSYMLLTLLRLTTKKNYKSYSLVMKPVGPYRNIKHIALFSQANTKLISNHQSISSCQGHSYKSLLLL